MDSAHRAVGTGVLTGLFRRAVLQALQVLLF
jgi:hypothetical protein